MEYQATHNLRSKNAHQQGFTMPKARFSSFGLFCATLTGLSAATGMASAQETGAYSTVKEICQGDPSKLVLVTEELIEGPDFACTLSNFAPAGSGLANYDGVCTINGKEVKGYVTFDLGNYDDHYEVSIPNSTEWLTLYPCSGAKQ